MSILSINQASQTMDEARHLKKQMGGAQKLTSIAKFLQRERGMSCVFLSSKRWYTHHVDKLLISIHDSLRKTAIGKTWDTVGSYLSVLKAMDLVGIRRAMGGAYFAAGGFQDATFAHYFEVAGGARFMLDASFMGFPLAKKYFEDVKIDNEQLILTIEGLESKIVQRNIDQANPELGLAWFEHMTKYLAILGKTEQMISETIIEEVEIKFHNTATSYCLAISIVVASMIISPIAICSYAYQSQKMMKKIRKFTASLSSKTDELKTEKSKTDMLLYQMLPISIVKSLKLNKEVEPEDFQLVTIFFSDILGFTTLASRCSPIEVVALLNRLYVQCDAILNQYDVYKVETIGDGYMVASGLPKRNGENHGSEIATLALDVMRMMDGFLIPYMNGETLLMRIGIHTGPCAAGIVGSKMPRYCLFGDTVNTASRMESNGKGMRIQISDATKHHLTTKFRGKFQIKERGKVPIKGKGTMTTHWLLSKTGFPYQIDLERAEARVQRSTYWKLIDNPYPEPTGIVDGFLELPL